MSKAHFSHIFPISVRWGDADVFGHINGVQFVRYIESGRVSYCEDVMNMPLVVGMESGWVIADIQCSYLQQVHYPEVLEVRTRISKIGNKSATILADIYREGEDKPVVTSKGVMVWFDFVQQRASLIPEDLRQKIVVFEHVVEQL